MGRKRDAADTDNITVRTMIAAMGRLEAENGRQGGLLEDLATRLALVEERERHMLTRAAVHEAWDQMAFAFIVAHNPDFDPPPPLRDPHRLQTRHRGEH